MSHVELKKRPCRRVDFKGLGPSAWNPFKFMGMVRPCLPLSNSGAYYRVDPGLKSGICFTRKEKMKRDANQYNDEI